MATASNSCSALGVEERPGALSALGVVLSSGVRRKGAPQGVQGSSKSGGGLGCLEAG